MTTPRPRAARPSGRGGRHAARWSTVAALLRPQARALTIGAAAGAGAALAGAGLLATSTYLLQHAAEQPPVLALMVAIVAVRALALVRAVARWQERTAVHGAGLALVRDLRARVVAALVPRVPEGLRARPGAVLDGVVRDLAAVERALVAGAVPFLAAAATAAVAVPVAAVMAPGAALALAAGLAAGIVAVPRAAGRATGRVRGELAHARAELTAATVDTLAEAAELAVAGTASRRRERLARLADRVDGLEASLARRRALVTLALAAVSAATVAGVLVAGAGAVAAGTLAPVAFGALVMLAVGALDPVAALPAAGERIDEALAAWDRIDRLVSAPVPVADTGDDAARTVLPLALRGVHVRRPGEPVDVLRDVSLAVGRHDRVLVTGPSGSGKSTLAATLVRFLAPRTGDYTVAGRRAEELAGDAVRRRLGLAGQDAHVFPVSLADNLRLAAPSAADHDLWRALDAVDLGDWARSLDAGLATRLGPDGAWLSGGQRRRLATAQVLLADVEALVLDEPTAELDPVTARRVVDRVLAAAGPRPVVLVSHRDDLGAATQRLRLAAGAG